MRPAPSENSRTRCRRHERTHSFNAFDSVSCTKTRNNVACAFTATYIAEGKRDTRADERTAITDNACCVNTKW